VIATARASENLRSDARRNRALVVAAARAVFAEQGIDASVEAIVERAGVGTGTLYRHFPNGEALVDAIFAERTAEFLEVIERALVGDDPSCGLQQLLEQMVVLQRSDRVLKELLMRSLRPILDATADIAPEAWRRHLNFVLDGLRPQAATRSPVPPLTAEELAAATQCLRAERFGRRTRTERPRAR